MNRPLAVALLTFSVGIAAAGTLSLSNRMLAETTAQTAAPTTVAPKPAGKASGAVAYTPANVAAGQQVFLQRCMQCHSVAEGEVRFGPSLFGVMKGPKPRKTPAGVREILHDGKNKMPSFKDVLAPDEVDHIIAYLHSL